MREQKFLLSRRDFLARMAAFAGAGLIFPRQGDSVPLLSLP